MILFHSGVALSFHNLYKHKWTRKILYNIISDKLIAKYSILFHEFSTSPSFFILQAKKAGLNLELVSDHPSNESTLVVKLFLSSKDRRKKSVLAFLFSGRLLADSFDLREIVR